MKSVGSTIYSLEGIQVQPARRCIVRDERPIFPRAKTFQLLIYLLERPNQLVTKEELVDNLWSNTAVTDNSLVQCVIELRKALGDDAHNPRFIRTIPKSGYQLIAPVEEIPGESGASEVEEVTTVEVEYEVSHEESPTLPPPLPRLRRKVALAVVSALIAITGLAIFVRTRTGARLPYVAGNSSLIVMQFDNESGTADLDWLRAGLSDMLITNLSRSPKLSVLSRQQLSSLLRRSGHKNANGGLDDALQIAKKSHAETVILGSFAKLGEKVRIGVELHKVANGQLLAAESATADRPEQILAEMDLLSLKLAKHLGSPPAAPESRAGLSMRMTNSLEAYRNYSVALEKAQAYHSKEAIALLEQAVALDPNFAMAHARIGYIYAVTWGLASQGHPYLERAFKLSDRLTEKDRLNIAAWYALSDLDYSEAIRKFRELIAAYPEEEEGYLRLGHLMRGERRYEEAIEMLQRGSVIDPDAPDIYNVLGGIYSQLGRHSEAIAVEHRYVALSPDEPNAYDSLALAYQWAGRHQEAKESYAQALRLKPDFEISVVNLGNLYYQMGRYKDALRQYQTYIRLAPSDSERARGYGCLAWIYRRTGDLRRAEEAAKNEMLHDPTSVGNSVLLALGRGDWRLAETLSTHLFDKPAYSHRGARPPQRFQYYFLGQKALQMGLPDEAVAHFQEALRHWPPWGGMESREDCLADADLKLGLLDDAIAEYQRALRIYPGDGLSHYKLGLAYARKGLPNAARTEFGKFLNIWSEADPDIREVNSARSYLAGC